MSPKKCQDVLNCQNFFNNVARNKNKVLFMMHTVERLIWSCLDIKFYLILLVILHQKEHFLNFSKVTLHLCLASLFIFELLHLKTSGRFLGTSCKFLYILYIYFGLKGHAPRLLKVHDTLKI